ncbi:hypothetical protein [Amycolatopsis magusensis]|uniref:hypothetical protein n=1 Tax=Amycolatopsis magusensis TaxID=882444 RepID=UPI003C2F1AEF
MAAVQPSGSGGYQVKLAALEPGKESLAELRRQFAAADKALNGNAEARTLDEGKIAGFGKDPDMWRDFPSGIRDGKRELATVLMNCLQQLMDGRKALHESFTAFETRFGAALNSYQEAEAQGVKTMSAILKDLPGTEKREGS